MNKTQPDLSAEDLGKLVLSLDLDNSILTRCLNCNLWGTTVPGNTECGNCNSTDTVIYIPSDSVLKIMKHLKESEKQNDQSTA